MAGNGSRPPDTAEKQLGEIVADVTKKAQLLVREEVELAKTEIQERISRIVKGTVSFAAAGFFGLMMLVFLLHFLSFGFANWFSLEVWVGYGITTGILLFITLIAALVGLRLVKKGTPPVPEMAIEEAQKTREALEEVRS